MTYVTSWIWTLPMRCSPVDNNSKAYQRGSRFSYNSCYWYHVIKPSLMTVFNRKANKLHFAPCRWWEDNCRKVLPLSNLQTVASYFLHVLSCLLCQPRKWSKNTLGAKAVQCTTYRTGADCPVKSGGRKWSLCTGCDCDFGHFWLWSRPILANLSLPQ